MTQKESVRKRVLAAAQRLCETRDDWTFTPAEIVRLLPGVNEATVRTEVTGRCCVNAPDHHARRWPYFRRLARGLYQIEPAFRERPAASAVSRAAGAQRSPVSRVAETASAYGGQDVEIRDTVHAVVTESEGWYVAECLELGVVTQARSFDELLANPRSDAGSATPPVKRGGPSTPPRGPNAARSGPAARGKSARSGGGSRDRSTSLKACGPPAAGRMP